MTRSAAGPHRTRPAGPACPSRRRTAILAQPVEQDVGERAQAWPSRDASAGTPCEKCSGRPASADEHEEMLVPFLGRRCADRDLVAGARRPEAMSSRIQRRASTTSARGLAQDTTAMPAAGGRSSATSAPLYQPVSAYPGCARTLARARPALHQRAPDWRDAPSRSSSTGPSTAARMFDTMQRGVAQIARRQDSRRQAVAHPLLDRGKIGEPSMLSGSLGERDIGLPDLRQRMGDRSRRAWKQAQLF